MKTASGIFLVIVITTLFNFSNFAQSGKKNLEKDLNTFNIYFINGYALSYNYFTTENFSLRALLDFSANGTNLDNMSFSSGSSSGGYNTKSEGRSESDQTNFNISLSTHLIYPVYNSNYGQVYLGIGPMLGYSIYSTTQVSDSKFFSPDTTSNPNINYNENEYTTENYNAGLIAIAGIKAYITETISLFAESHFTGGRTWADYKSNSKYKYNLNDEGKDVNNSDGNGWFYCAQYVRLGVIISL